MRRGFFIKLLAGIVIPITILTLLYGDSLSKSTGFHYRHDTSRQLLDYTKELNSRGSLVSPKPLTMEASVENIPGIYLDEKSKKPSKYNKTCAKYPDLFDLRFTNDHWQTQLVFNGTFQLLNAYYDERLLENPYIRIVGMLDLIKPDIQYHCQLWYENTTIPEIVPVADLHWIWVKGWGGDKDRIYQPYIITCPLSPKKKVIPSSVSLVEEPCTNATNNLRVNYKATLEVKKDFVVCVKGMNFAYQDKTAKLAEWIELVNLLGADKINFYEFKVHPNIRKLFDYYVEQGKVEVTPLSLVGSYSNHPYLQDRFLHKKLIHRRLQEVIPYNDCLYKYLPHYKFIVLLDTDEVIVPTEDTWFEIIDQVYDTKKPRSSYVARNMYFLDSHKHEHEWFEDVPKYMHMLQHVYRAENYTKPGHFVKGFHNTNLVLSLHNHFPIKCVYGNCNATEIDQELAHLQHYRKDCVSGVGNCDDMKANSILDTRVWNFKEELINRVEQTLNDLDFVESTD